MTRPEFNKWVGEWFTAFPDSHAWLEKLPNKVGTLEVWFRTLSRTSYADVMAATAKIIVGELNPLAAYEREQTALHIRAYAGRIADDRNRVQKNTREHEKFVGGRERNRKQSGPSTAGMFKAILEFREEAKQQGLEGVELNEYASERLQAWIDERAEPEFQ